MQLLSSITIRNNEKRPVIELLHGDLSAVPFEHASDILVISAFPGDYDPSPGTLMEALDKKGLSVAELSKHKACDLRGQLGCWLSDHLTMEQQQQFNFSHILCFEPLLHADAPAEVVGNIFRCINTFVFDDDHNAVAMPILATGNQNVPIEKMLPALLENGLFWMEQGLPLDAIKLVVYDEDQLEISKKIFAETKRQYEGEATTGVSPLESLSDEPQASGNGKDKQKPAAPARVDEPSPAPPRMEAPSPALPPPDQYDYFISYAHKHAEVVNAFVESIRQLNKGLKIFYDRSSILPGGLWIKQISDAIQKARKVIVLITPDYCNSPVCWDEFQCAKLMEYNRRQPIIQTIYLYSEAALPPMMGIYSYIDCREGDSKKLAEATRSLLALS